MPLIIGLLIVIAAVYQLFFRYESWQSDEKPGVVYEHDNLTGQTHILKPGAHLNVFARILGQDGKGGIGEHHFLEPFTDSGRDTDRSGSDEDNAYDDTDTLSSTDGTSLDLHDRQQVEKVARPIPTPREVVVASSAPPVPAGSQADGVDALESAKPFAVRQIDLNRDGSVEEIIQNATQADGLLDISIVKNGREIFFGRGKQISLLPSRSQGWSDIALKMGAKTLQVFRYDAKEAAYRALDPSKS
jgi:hypothetical protein